MALEYSFKLSACDCGADLTGLKAEVTFIRFGTSPLGKCPECGREMLLDVPAPEPPAKARSSRKVASKPKA